MKFKDQSLHYLVIETLFKINLCQEKINQNCKYLASLH